MGQCGCADFSADYKLKAPNGWYVLQLYPGCDYCNNPAGFIIYKMDAEDVKTWNLNGIKETEIRDHGRLIPIIHQEQLEKKITEFLTGVAGSLASEFISDSFQDAIHDSFEK